MRGDGPFARRVESELNTVRESLLQMAGRVEQMIAESSRALVQRDVELARRIIELDQEVNRYEIETDELCLQVLAKGQLAAASLRFVTLAMKMVTDLERIADLAVNICERAIDLAGAEGIVVHPDLPSMSVRVQEMVHLAIDAFVDRDVSKAREVIARDDEV
ncbi:MAG: phosphate signaling complex protein PhoU, partial [Myxococcota bacterium]